MWKQEWVQDGFDMALHYMAFRLNTIWHVLGFPHYRSQNLRALSIKDTL